LNPLRKISLLFKELGIANLASFGFYQLQLKSGWLRNRTPLGGFHPRRELMLESPARLSTWKTNWDNAHRYGDRTLLTKEAALLVKSEYRPFHGSVELLTFSKKASPDHWTSYSNEFEGKDIKFAWEPARFTWSLALARAYKTTGDKQFSKIFWQKFEEFTAANPVNSGPNWASAQEVALRMTMWIFAISAFKDSPTTTPARINALTESIRHHVERLLSTLSYARSQHNNHLLSEALGLMLGGDYLLNCDSRAQGWIERGIREFEQAILSQVDENGNYAQHSANYHRMMMQLALLYSTFLGKSHRKMPENVKSKLALAACWLIAQLDLPSGRLPNLGHNDGTLLLPFGSAEFRDYRPTAQAASIVFLGHPCLPLGHWDELATWLELQSEQPVIAPHEITSPAVHKVGTTDCRGTLRGVRFRNRPAHADQLHVEIWCGGENLARDAGTYLYNALPPWQNALDTARVHNTITVDGQDQMQRVSRFLWLDQAQASWLVTDNKDKIAATHNGYRKLGILHQRSLEFRPPQAFLITDSLSPASADSREHFYRLHWLLPDWEWTLDGQQLSLSRDPIKVSIQTKAISQSTAKNLQPADVSLIRGGQTLAGQSVDEILGWESDTYGEKHPALSLSLRYQATGAITITTEWNIIKA